MVLHNAWSADEIARLVNMRARGIAFSEIGRTLGRSRSACVGRATRMGLGEKVTPSAPSKADGVKTRATPKATPPSGPIKRQSPDRVIKLRRPPTVEQCSRVETVTQAPPADVSHVPLLALGPGMCRWLYGGDAYCGAPGFPWCPHHRARVFDRHLARASPPRPKPRGWWR